MIQTVNNKDNVNHVRTRAESRRKSLNTYLRENLSFSLGDALIVVAFTEDVLKVGGRGRMGG